MTESCGWASDNGQRYLFTDDMLYVDQLFKDGRQSSTEWPTNPQRGFRANDMAIGQESFNGFFTRLDNGCYILTSGFTDCRVFELKGLDTLRRLEGGTVTLGAEQLARGAEVMSAWDDANLYVAWEVRKPIPLRNTAGTWQLAFAGGDAVDLMYRRPGEKLDDAKPRAGDLTPDCPGGKQPFAGKAWYELFFTAYAGVDVGIDGLSLRPTPVSEAIEIGNLVLAGRRVDIRIGGRGAGGLRATLNGKAVADPGHIPFSAFKAGANRIEVVRGGRPRKILG